MKARLFAYLLVGTVVSVTQAFAAPTSTPFLSVDVDGYNAGGGQVIGPTEPGFERWELAEGLLLPPDIDWSAGGAAGISKSFATSQGIVTAVLSGIGASNGARNRGGNTGGFDELYQDFVFAQVDFGNDQLGRNYIKLELTGPGIVPSQDYELTWFAREAAFNGVDQTGDSDTASYEAFSDLDTLGVDGPAAWLDANVGAGASYPPPADNGGIYANPIPTLVRIPTSGPDADSSSDPYHHAAIIITKSDADGIITVYAWGDGNSFLPDVQNASLINGFQLGLAVPEPSALALFCLGALGVAALRRRRGCNGNRTGPGAVPSRSI